MIEMDFRAGVFIIFNEKKNKLYYACEEELEKAVKEHLSLLKQGTHSNDELQQDYTLQNGQHFIIKIVGSHIDMNCARQILQCLLISDDTAYNHKLVDKITL